MSEENRCPACGAPLPARAPHGLCPGCLLKKGIDTVPPASEEASQASADFTPPTPAEFAAQFPDLEINEFIGRGGMGMVYKARQKHLDRLVALKILLPKIASDPAFAERFAREARAMAILSHPHIVTVHDFGQKNDIYYFLMEFVDGLTLRQLLDSGKLTPQEVLAIVPQICEALQYAHDKGVVHRDIKPENILMDRSGQVKIADFGLAKLVGQEASDFSLTGAGQVMGTPHYMAPEQLEHPQEVDHRADIYSLGVVFYQMLTGELPIGRFAPPSKKVQIDVRLDEVVLRALEKEPELRFQQASDVKTQVEAIATGPVGSKVNNQAWQSPKSGWGHFVGYLFGTTFNSRLAYNTANFSALGFVAFLAFLSYLPFPGSDRLQAFSGFSGFFGLIGVAFIIEFVKRRTAQKLAGDAKVAPRAAHMFFGLVVGSILLGILGYNAVTNYLEKHDYRIEIPRMKAPTVLSKGVPTQPATTQQLSRGPAPTAEEHFFGPVNERVVNDAEAIAFNSGLHAALPGDAKKDSPKGRDLTVVAWMVKEHLDAFYTTRDGLAGIGMDLKPLSNDDWEQLAPSQLKQAFADTSIAALSKRVISQGTTVPATRAFKTREGSVGILQIVGFTDNPPGVKIRYKLLQESALPARPTVRTQMLGRVITGKTYKEFSDVPGGARLIGFQVGLGEFIGKRVVSSLRPIYSTLRGEVNGFEYGKADGGAHPVIKAKDGYAVGGITVSEGLGIDGLSATFMRVRGDVLDPADSYSSDWVGSKNGGSETRLAGTGALVVGIFGRLNSQQTLGGLGLVLDGTVPEEGRK